MLRRYGQLACAKLRASPRAIAVQQRSCAATVAVAGTASKWDLYAGIVVERPPVVSKSLNPLEKEFQEQLWRVELENSLKSDHELQHERELLQADLIKKGKIEVDLDETSSKQTVQDLQDAYAEELKKFALAPRSTSYDAVGDTTKTNRCLEQTLYLVVEQKFGKQNYWLLPQGLRLEGETMRQAAERVLCEQCGDTIKVNFYGNAPCGFYKFKYPSTIRDHRVGAKVFFYRAVLQQGNVVDGTSQKFQWLEKASLSEKLQHPTYVSSIQKFLM